jgi:hypothetical protein
MELKDKENRTNEIGRWIHNCKENFSLASARDALLPKLLSGDLKVS